MTINKFFTCFFFLFIFSAAVHAQEPKFEFNGAADVFLSYPPRGSGGRAIVHDGGNVLSLNYGGDFTGGTRIGNVTAIENNGGIRVGNAGAYTNSRSSFNAYTSGLDAQPNTGWIAADFGGADNTTDRLVIGTGFGGKAVIGTHNYNLTAWGGDLLISPLGGKVGIGTTVPDAPLTVYGNSNIYPARTGSGDARVFRITTTIADFPFLNNDYPVILSSGGGNQPLVLDAARIGIGTSSPQERLSVNGKIGATEIQIRSDGWPDYVFKADYQLPSLPEIEQQIKLSGHLSEIPSAKDVETNGVALGEMNKLLLKKVEELTLHLIEKDKQIKSLIQRMDHLERKSNKEN
ncbi:hypothetical protein ACJVDH_05910 [Pedobacter sp. AW1-32]|uniref:hypothetical protein n=1 Tax=Pedobacter sp. AW1-32 TaxID=3383026 RepID=UPI003FEE9C4F